MRKSAFTSNWSLVRPAAAVVALTTGLLGGGESSAETPKVKTYALVPADPGFPEGIVVHGKRVFVSGPARFGTAGTGPSAIWIYSRTSGKLVTTILVVGEDLQQEHALSNIAVDDDGRVYALSTQLGLIRFTNTGQETYAQEAYGDPLPMISPAPPLPNDIVFDAVGNAYVSDSLQAAIFRYPPGGGAPELWFQSPQLLGGGMFPFGPNGLRLDPHRQHLYVVATTSLLDPARGTIYRIPLVESPEDDDLEVFHVYPDNELPDQLAFGKNGLLFVSLAGSDQISVLNPEGKEIGRIGSGRRDRIPLDGPAGLAFDSQDKTLLIVNHALLTADPAHFAVLRVKVWGPGDPLEKPQLP